MRLTLILPLYNEEKNLKKNFDKIYKCVMALGNSEIILAEDGSTDGTRLIANKLSVLSNVKLITSDNKLGRGKAIRNAIKIAKGNIIGYMDIDLAVPIRYLPKAVSLVENGNTMVTGSRYVKASVTHRRIKRLVASKVYNYMINIIFLSKVHDHQCGFKFWSCDFIKKEAKKIKDDHWFFDTEIILRSQKLGIVPYELPVKWTEQRSSKVKGSDINYFLSSIIKKFVSK